MNDVEGVAFYRRTQHCAGCGNPGTYCTCTKACPCSELHTVGSARLPGALAAFGSDVDELPPAEVGEDQPELFA